MTAFPYICGEGVSKFVGGLSGHSLAAKGGIEGRWSGRLCRPDERVPFSLFVLFVCLFLSALLGRILCPNLGNLSIMCNFVALRIRSAL